jgi:hypothetical protein
MKSAVAFMGTPGALFSVVMQSATGHLVVLDRKADTWERVCRETVDKDADLERYAVLHEPSMRATTCKSQREARELAARVSGLSRSEARAEMDKWESFSASVAT